MFPFRSELRRRAAAWALRRQGADRFPARLHGRRLYILPTRAGVGFAVLVLGMLVAALNYGNGTALWLAGMLGGLALVAMHRSHRNLLGLEITSVETSPAFAGGRGMVSVVLTNSSRLPRYGVEIDNVTLSGAARRDASRSAAGAAGRARKAAARPLEDPAIRATAVAGLPPQAALRVDLEIPAARRGLLRIERLRLSTTQPFGLFRAWTWIHAPLVVVVFPRPRGDRPSPRHDGVRQGASRSEGGTDRDEWRALRAFREGDSPRQVAWKAYARGAPLLVKEYAASGSERRLFDFGRLAGLDVEARLEQLARWIVDAEARGERYGLVLPGTTLPHGRGAEHRRRALTALALHGIQTL